MKRPKVHKSIANCSACLSHIAHIKYLEKELKYVTIIKDYYESKYLATMYNVLGEE